MIKKIFVFVCFSISFITFAQEGTSSPYSFYGIGDVKFKGTTENRSMGSLSIFKDSIHLNLQNPASLSNIKQTTFTIGANTNTTIVNTATIDDKTKRTTLDYFAVGLPLGKIGVSFGLLPYSSIGYRVQSTDDANTLRKFNGKGSINKVYIGMAYEISKTWSVGATIDYNFGNITTNSYLFPDQIALGTREQNTSNVRGATITTGLMYQSNFKGKKQIFGGFTFSPETTLNFNNTRTIATLPYSISGTDVIYDVFDAQAPNNSIKMPTKITAGLGVGVLRKWQIGAQVDWQQSSKMGNRFNDIDQIIFENATKFAVGGLYINKYNSFTSYLDRIVIRGGFYFQNTGMVINGQSIKDRAFMAGLGLPLYGTFSNINIGMEFGKRGTTNAGLIEENYTNIHIGLSFNDLWFKKRKYE